MNFDKLRKDMIQKFQQEIENGNDDAVYAALEIELATDDDDLIHMAKSYNFDLSEY